MKQDGSIMLIGRIHRRLGVLVQPGNRSVRSCVRASEAACARETMLFPWLGDFSERVLRGGAGRGAARALAPAVQGLLCFWLGSL